MAWALPGLIGLIANFLLQQLRYFIMSSIPSGGAGILLEPEELRWLKTGTMPKQFS